MKTYVMGDVHGGHKAMVQCLKRAKFNYDKDTLIFLGDVADGWPETYECVEELMKVKNLVYIMGNHDEWLLGWLEYGRTPDIWTTQGGKQTLDSYLKYNPSDWNRHLEFLKKVSRYYYVDENNRCFVHAGVSQKGTPINECDTSFLCWDRELWDNRNNLEKVEPFDEIYVGHTSIWKFSKRPIKYGNVWFLDTGGGWEGKVSLMDIESKKVFQSDLVGEMYNDSRGRDEAI